MFESLDISSSALSAQRARLDTIANNIANVNTTKDPAGNNAPYRRRFAVFAPGQANDPSRPGVHVASVQVDHSPFREIYEPGSKDADARGYIKAPNVDMAIEVVNAMEATRAYEANVTTIEVTKSMMNASLRLLA